MIRFLDIIISVIFLLLFLPFFIICLLIVWLDTGSPLYIQKRLGLNLKTFNLVKFRTMKMGTKSKATHLVNKSNITIIGNFLRRLKIDEIPQLFNVLLGSMSLVGPRPLLMEYMSLYSSEQARRHDVRPGITGWAQINGRNAISWEQKFKYDIWYVENKSFWLDVKIIWMTIKKVIARDGISAENHATMPKFTASKDLYKK